MKKIIVVDTRKSHFLTQWPWVEFRHFNGFYKPIFYLGPYVIAWRTFKFKEWK